MNRIDNIERNIGAINNGCGELQRKVKENSELLNIRMDTLEQNQVALNNKIEYIMEYLCDTVDRINKNSDMDDETAEKVNALEQKVELMSEPKYIIGIDLANNCDFTCRMRTVSECVERYKAGLK